LAALLLLGFIGLIALGAYGVGFAAGNASPAFTPANPAAWAYGGGYGFGFGHFIGFVVSILIFIIVVRLILAVIFGGHRRHWGPRGYWQGGDPAQFGPSGPFGGWNRGPWHEVGQSYFDEFHSRAHGNVPPAGGPAAGGPTAGGPATGGTAADQPRGFRSCSCSRCW
jgi:hypothetical protein